MLLEVLCWDPFFRFSHLWALTLPVSSIPHLHDPAFFPFRSILVSPLLNTVNLFLSSCSFLPPVPSQCSTTLIILVPKMPPFYEASLSARFPLKVPINSLSPPPKNPPFPWYLDRGTFITFFLFMPISCLVPGRPLKNLYASKNL